MGISAMNWSAAHWAFLLLSAVLMVGSLAIALRPLWRRRATPTAVMIGLLCLSTAALYHLIGTPQALERRALAQPETIEEAIVLLERQLAAQPDREGYALLASAHARNGQAAKARDTWEKALALAPEDPDLLTATAESRLTAAEGRFDGRAIGLLEQALRRDPAHQRARFFLGLGHRQQGRAAEAATTWEPLLSQLPAEESTTLRKEIAAARSEAGLPALAEAEAPGSDVAGSAPTSASAEALTVEVALDPEFASRVRLHGDASVFVIARAPDGPPMPVAVEKHRIADLPLRIVLDDGDGPMPTAKLSSLKEVEVIARVSESGTANRQEGDIESPPVRVRLPANAPVRLRIGAE